MRQFQKTPLVLMTLFSGSGCLQRIETISSRAPASFEKVETGPLNVRGRDLVDPVGPPEIFVRTKGIKVNAKNPHNATGSLYNSEDERNFLFITPPPTVGSFVVVNVVSKRMDLGKVDTASGKKTPAPVATSAPGATPVPGPGGAPAGDDIESTLVKALPHLEPASSEPTLLKRFDVKVASIYENGDALVQLQRRSIFEDEASDIDVTARVSYSRLISGEPLTTDDLSDVKWMESSNGQIAERRSTGWEDEYTLRLSGFDEAKSKTAIVLEDKRKQLKDIRDKLDTRIKTLAEERNQVAKQREELMARAKTDETKILELQKTVDEQKQQIEQAKPQEKPGDQKDAAKGR